jgi:hypothetical protein
MESTKYNSILNRSFLKKTRDAISSEKSTEAWDLVAQTFSEVFKKIINNGTVVNLN